MGGCSLLSQNVDSLIEVPTAADYRNARWQVDIESRLGHALANLYPNRDWYIDANPAQGVVTVKCASISMDYGMVVHLTHDMFEVERRAKLAAGELLERFRLSRSRQTNGVDNDELKRNIKGEVLGASKGEYAH